MHGAALFQLVLVAAHGFDFHQSDRGRILYSPGQHIRHRHIPRPGPEKFLPGHVNRRRNQIRRSKIRGKANLFGIELATIIETER